MEGGEAECILGRTMRTQVLRWGMMAFEKWQPGVWEKIRQQSIRESYREALIIM